MISYFHNLETVGQVVQEGFLEGAPWVEGQGLATVWLGSVHEKLGCKDEVCLLQGPYGGCQGGWGGGSANSFM